MKDLLVQVKSPKALDDTVQAFGAVVLEDAPGIYMQDTPGVYVVRCFGDHKFVKFAITTQGYGSLVGERDIEPPSTDSEAPND